MPGIRPSKLCIFALLLLLPAACVSRRIPEDLSIKSSSGVDRSTDREAKQRAYKDWRRNYDRIQSARDLERRATTTKDPRAATRHAEQAESLLREIIHDDKAPQDLKDRAQKMLDRPSATAHSAPAKGVNSRAQWGALSSNVDRLNRVGGSWEKITIHHSDEVGALVFNGTFQQSCDAIRSIQRQHLVGNGWGDIGYHFLIDGRGRVFEGRSLEWQGAHAGNPTKNRRNIGVCLLGDFDEHQPSAQASESLRKLLDDLKRRHGISREKIYMHSEFMNTVCPGRHLTQWVKAYRSR